MMPAPEKGDPWFDVFVAALDVVTSPPLRKGTNVYAASVPWSEIELLRDAFTVAGIDWGAVRAKRKGG